MHTGILLDLDGTLLDTERLKARAHARAITRFGGRMVPPAFYASVMGRSQGDVQAAFAAHAGVEVPPAEYGAAFRDEYLALLDAELRPCAGAPELLAELRRRGHRLALVTSSLRWMVDRAVRQLPFLAAVDAVVCAEDVRREKPAPDAYVEALRRLGVAPRAAVVLEDSEAGVQAGRAAGAAVVAVRHAFNVGHAFTAATSVLASLHPTGAAVGAIEAPLR